MKFFDKLLKTSRKSSLELQQVGNCTTVACTELIEGARGWWWLFFIREGILSVTMNKLNRYKNMYLTPTKIENLSNDFAFKSFGT